MHLVVSWDITEGLNRTEISNEMIAILTPYPGFRPLTTFYIIKANTIQREVIRIGLQAVANRYPDRIGFCVSPVMTGQYAGALPQPYWESINLVTAD